MQTRLQVVLSVFVVSAVTAAHANEPPLRPPIFAARDASLTLPPSPARQADAPTAMVSPRMRAQLTARILEGADTAASPAQPTSAMVTGDAVVLEPFVVAAPLVRAERRASAAPPVLSFLKTGNLLRVHGRRFDTSVDLKVLLLAATGPHRNEEFTRYQVNVTFTW